MFATAASAAMDTQTSTAAGTADEALLLLRESGLRAESLLPRHVGVVIDGVGGPRRRAAPVGAHGAALPGLGHPGAHRLHLLPREHDDPSQGTAIASFAFEFDRSRA
jgi:hypothetical protein